jgi:hypothetical protein
VTSGKDRKLKRKNNMCEQREIKEVKDDNAFDCGARVRQSFTREIEFCKEYYLPCDDILDCENKFKEIL